MTTPRAAANAVKRWLTDRNITVEKVTGKTVSFQDLLGKDGVFVFIRHARSAPEPWMAELKAAFQAKTCGFIVMLDPDTFFVSK